MKILMSLAALLASSSAFAYQEGSYTCGPTTYTLARSNIDGLPVVTITGFNNTMHKGLGQISETINEKGQTVETIRYSLGARSMQIQFVDDRAVCTN